jgi:hypothetical protein
MLQIQKVDPIEYEMISPNGGKVVLMYYLIFSHIHSYYS